MSAVYVDDSYADSEDADLWFGGVGWYFIDEIQMYRGPYASQEEAMKALRDYVYNL